MNLRSRVLEGLRKRKQKLIDGGINSVPSPFIRFSDDFIGLEQAKYYVITSSTKGAKTQFASFVFVFHTLLYAYQHPEQLRIRIFYYPLEETPDDIMTRFMSYLLYTKSAGAIRIAPKDLKSSRNDKPIDDKYLELLDSEEYSKIIDFFEEHIVFSASTNPTGVYNECKRYAEEHGTVFKRKQKIKDEFTGQTREIDAFDHYIQDDPDEYRIIFYDHVSLTSAERGMSLKQSIDKLSEYFVLLRNRYGYSPVVIQQQAFEGESLDAIRSNKVRPTIANLADSKYTARDCNVALGLFSPFKYELPEYMQYDITKLKDNVRFLEILVNRGGSPGGLVALYFDGAVNFFKELPRPEEKQALNTIYDYLVASRKRINTTFIAYTKQKFKPINSNYGKLLHNLRKIWYR
jgi:hypothetical protein